MFNQFCRNKIAITLIRLMLGLIFMAHGAQKVFGLFGGPGLDGFAQWLGAYGVPTYLAYLAAFAEFFGGLLLFTGFQIVIGALMTTAVMLGAIFIIHWPKFFVQNQGFEYPLVLIICTIAVLIGEETSFGSRECCEEDEEEWLEEDDEYLEDEEGDAENYN